MDRQINESTVEINGESFIVHHMHGLTHLSHPEFPLAGTGESVEKAKHDVGACCGILLDYFPDFIPPEYESWVEQTAKNNPEGTDRCQCKTCQMSRRAGRVM